MFLSNSVNAKLSTGVVRTVIAKWKFILKLSLHFGSQIASFAVAFFLSLSSLASAADRVNILDFGPGGMQVDRTGSADASQALSKAVVAANSYTSRGMPACVYVPSGIYRISTPPPQFERAGCVIGDGASQSIIKLDARFQGDLFSWSEAWIVTTPGPMVVGLKVVGSKTATAIQNAFVFYDRNDQVFFDNVDVVDLHGRALYSGLARGTPQGYMRESHFRSLRFFGDGAPDIPVVEFNSQGTGETDATNEIRMSQVDIYGARGPGLVIRNEGNGVVRSITIDSLRIEGSEDGTSAGDLLVLGDPSMRGRVNTITLTALELIDPSKGYAALRISAPSGVPAPYNIFVQGFIDGGVAAGQGLCIDAGRNSVFHFTSIHTSGTNVTIGRGVSNIILDGTGQESSWTYSIDATSVGAIRVPVMRSGIPSKP